MRTTADGGFHSLHARSLRGEDLDFARWAGHPVLVVNTASECGFTPQYAGLQKLHEEWSGRGLVVLGFPCNQFGGQEPGGRETIETCLVDYGVDFQMFEKVEVNGANAHPVFRWLTTRLPGLLGRPIRWNFTKFLVGGDGTPLRRFAPFTPPAKLEAHVRAALASV